MYRGTHRAYAALFAGYTFLCSYSCCTVAKRVCTLLLSRLYSCSGAREIVARSSTLKSASCLQFEAYFLFNCLLEFLFIRCFLIRSCKTYITEYLTMIKHLHTSKNYYICIHIITLSIRNIRCLDCRNRRKTGLYYSLQTCSVSTHLGIHIYSLAD